MKFTKEELDGFKNDPLMRFFTGLLGTSVEELISDVEKEQESRTEKVQNLKAQPLKSKDEEEENIGDSLKKFFDKLVEEGRATATVENGHPHYSIKLDDEHDEPKAPEMLLEEDEDTSFSMSKEELKKFIENYTKLDNTVKKLEHAYGIDLNANADSIYTQYNAIIWDLIENIFGSDNRDDIADYIFGDSNFDTIDDLYEELV